MRWVFRPPLGVSGRLVGSAAFKAVEGSLARLLVGSIPIHPRLDPGRRAPGGSWSNAMRWTHRAEGGVGAVRAYLQRRFFLFFDKVSGSTAEISSRPAPSPATIQAVPEHPDQGWACAL